MHRLVSFRLAAFSCLILGAFLLAIPAAVHAEPWTRPANRYSRAIYTDNGNGPPVSLIGQPTAAQPAGYGGYRYSFGNSYYYRYHPRYYSFDAYHHRPYPFSPYLNRRYPFGMGPYTNGFGGYSGYGYAPYSSGSSTAMDGLSTNSLNQGADRYSSYNYSYAPHTGSWYNGYSPYVQNIQNFQNLPYSLGYYNPNFVTGPLGYGYGAAVYGLGMPGYPYGPGANYFAPPNAY